MIQFLFDATKDQTQDPVLIKTRITSVVCYHKGYFTRNFDYVNIVIDACSTKHMVV